MVGWGEGGEGEPRNTRNTLKGRGRNIWVLSVA